MATRNSTTIEDHPGYQRLMDIQIQVEELEGTAQLAVEATEDELLKGPLGVIERRLREIRAEMDGLIPLVTTGKPNGAPARALDAVCQAADSVDLLQKTHQSIGSRRTDALLADAKRRLDTAVAVLDDAVPHPADAREPGNGALPDQARELFLQLWRDVREMTPEQCAKELDGRHLFEVGRRLAESDNFTIGQSVTLQGLRYEVTMARFRQALLYGPDATDLQLD